MIRKSHFISLCNPPLRRVGGVDLNGAWELANTKLILLQINSRSYGATAAAKTSTPGAYGGQGVSPDSSFSTGRATRPRPTMKRAQDNAMTEQTTVRLASTAYVAGRDK